MVQLVGSSFSALSFTTADYLDEIHAAQKSIREHKVFGCDIETDPNPGQEYDGANTCPHTSYVSWISVKTKDGAWDWAIEAGRNPLEHLEEFVYDKQYAMICHNAAFETKYFMHWYWANQKKRRAPKCSIICTMLASWMVNENRKDHRLKELTIDLLNRDVIKYDEAVRARSSLWDSWKWRQYSRDDSINCYDLWFQCFQRPLMADERTWKIFTEIELPNIITVAEQELIGIRGHRKRIKKYRKQAIADMKVREEAIYAKVGHTFNLNSPVQLAHVFFEEQKYSKAGIRRGKSGVPSMDEDTLAELVKRGHDLAQDLDEYKNYQKEVSGFWKQLDTLVNIHKGFFYPSVRTTNQVTGRWFVDKPTLSTLKRPPSLVRHGIIARKGYKLVGGDWSQAELRIVAHLSEDPTLIRAYQEDKDVHQITSDAVGCSRQEAKPINFGLIYLMGVSGLKFRLKKYKIVKTDEECAEYISRWFDTYPGVRHYHRRTEAFLRKHGYVRNPLGRVRHLNEMLQTFYNRAVRQAINTKVQSFVGDWMKLAQKNIRQHAQKKKLWAPDRCHLLFTVHDELIGEAPDGAAEEFRELMQHEMEKVVQIRVPVIADVKITNSWYEMKG